MGGREGLEVGWVPRPPGRWLSPPGLSLRSPRESVTPGGTNCLHAAVVSPLAVSNCLRSRKEVPQNSILGPSSLELGRPLPTKLSPFCRVSRGSLTCSHPSRLWCTPHLWLHRHRCSGCAWRAYQDLPVLRCSFSALGWAWDLNPDLVTPGAGPGRVSQETATPELGNPGQVFLPQFFAELVPLSNLVWP